MTSKISTGNGKRVQMSERGKVASLKNIIRALHSEGREGMLDLALLLLDALSDRDAYEWFANEVSR